MFTAVVAQPAAEVNSDPDGDNALR
jgi:hypothetical protein